MVITKEQAVGLAKKHNLMPELYNMEKINLLLREKGMNVDYTPMEATRFKCENEDDFVNCLKSYSNLEKMKKEVELHYGR